MESQRRLETDLLSKFRSMAPAKPKLMASSALDILKRDEMKMAAMNRKHQVINLDEQKKD
jgi:hypothetical protein